MFKVSLLIFAILFSSLFAKEQNKQIGIYEQLGSQTPLHLEFTNEYGEIKTLKEIFDNKPIVLTLNYFECPGLCSPLLNGVASVVNRLDLQPFIDYKVITVSFEKNDTPKLARVKKANLIDSIKKPFPPQTWNFLTSADQKTIDELTDTLGFKYEKRIKDGVVDYLHAGAIIVISPEGKVTRYLNGIEFLPFDLKLAIYEASKEKTGATIAKTLLFCFAYDAKSKTYVFQAEKVVGSFMFAIVFFFFFYLVKTGRKDKGDGHDNNS